MVEVNKEYKLNLTKLVEKYGIGEDVGNGLKVVESGVRDFQGRLVPNEKTYQLVTDDELENVVSSDGAVLEVADIDQWDNVTLEDVYDHDTFELELEAAELALEEYKPTN